MIMTKWLKTYVKVSRRIAEKGKELIIVVTRGGQYQNFEDCSLKFDYGKYW